MKKQTGYKSTQQKKMSQMLDKIKSKVDKTTKIEGDKPITMKEVKEATKALLPSFFHRMKPNTSKE